MLHPIVKLATSAIPAERKYIAFLGAGVSKDAGVPTAWDLMMATAALLRASESDGEADKQDLETWFLKSKYAKATYSELVGGLFSTSVEQQNFIRGKLDGHKAGKAHRLIADLAKKGVLRCAVTTNFDDLLEQALREEGVPVQVISNDDDLKNSEPLIHCKSFRLYKPHGTIGVGKLRNTPADLSALSSPMEEELIRVLSDHGLMVIGYAGQDPCIRKVFERRRHHLYPTFWISPSEPSTDIPALFGTETFTHVPCKGAGSFLEELLKMYKKLNAMAPTSELPAEVISTREAIEEGKSTAAASVKAFMSTLLENLNSIAPDFTVSGEHDEFLVQSLAKTPPLLTEFASIAQSIAENNDREAALALYHSFSKLLEKYENPIGFSGRYWKYQYDFYKFTGHELFTIFAAKLIREKRWDLLAEILEEKIYVENAGDNKADVVNFTYISEYVQLLDMRNKRLGLNRVSLHSDMLNERYSNGDLAEAVPVKEFMEADYFLFMRAEFSRNPDKNLWVAPWRPWSVLFMKQVPKYLIEAKSKKYAEQLLKPLGLKDVEMLKKMIKERAHVVKQIFSQAIFWDPPLTEYYKPEEIGIQ